jgi:hypothetical protein
VDCAGLPPVENADTVRFTVFTTDDTHAMVGALPATNGTYEIPVAPKLKFDDKLPTPLRKTNPAVVGTDSVLVYVSVVFDIIQCPPTQSTYCSVLPPTLSVMYVAKSTAVDKYTFAAFLDQRHQYPFMN